jgi:hypothetical protein
MKNKKQRWREGTGAYGLRCDQHTHGFVKIIAASREKTRPASRSLSLSPLFPLFSSLSQTDTRESRLNHSGEAAGTFSNVARKGYRHMAENVFTKVESLPARETPCMTEPLVPENRPRPHPG